MDHLIQRGVKYSILQTVTHDNLSRLAEDFAFLSQLGGVRQWGINFFLDIGEQGGKEAIGQSVSNSEFLEYLRGVVEHWLALRNPDCRIREIDCLLQGVMGIPAGLCSFGGECARFISVKPDGSVYKCDRYPESAENFLGSIATESLEEILSKETYKRHARLIGTILDQCKTCEWLAACHGGCTQERLRNGSCLEYCEARQRLFVLMRDKLRSAGILDGDRLPVRS